MKTRLASDASVVNNPALESGIVKIIGGGRLNAREQAACIHLKRSSDDTVVNPAVSKSLLASAFKKAPVTRSPPQYFPLEWAPFTSNECERFFSQSMDPPTLEVLMFLSYNKDRWEGFSVKAIRQSMRSQLRE
ncbi:hypothetical protein GN958_ATG17699 [Phytophthora infestans]|nr:hypothetical protein GN958_ATG17699 [Phytophthora infestans]